MDPRDIALLAGFAQWLSTYSAATWGDTRGGRELRHLPYIVQATLYLRWVRENVEYANALLPAKG